MIGDVLSFFMKHRRDLITKARKLENAKKGIRYFPMSNGGNRGEITLNSL